MTIEGFIQTGYDEAFFGTVHLVKDVRFYAGEIVGFMELSNGQDLIVKRHPCGNLNASIIKD